MNIEMPDTVEFKLIEIIENDVATVYVFEPTDDTAKLGRIKFLNNDFTASNLIGVKDYGVIMALKPIEADLFTGNIKIDVNGTIYSIILNEYATAGAVYDFPKDGDTPILNIGMIIETEYGDSVYITPPFNPDETYYTAYGTTFDNNIVIKIFGDIHKLTGEIVIDDLTYGMENNGSYLWGSIPVEPSIANLRIYRDSSLLKDYTISLAVVEPPTLNSVTITDENSLTVATNPTFESSTTNYQLTLSSATSLTFTCDTDVENTVTYEYNVEGSEPVTGTGNVITISLAEGSSTLYITVEDAGGNKLRYSFSINNF